MQCIIIEKHSNQINTPWWNKEKGSWLTDSQSERKPQVEPKLHKFKSEQLKIIRHTAHTWPHVIIIYFEI